MSAVIPKSIPAKYRPHILHWDDERNPVGSIIVTLVGLNLDGSSEGSGKNTTHVFGEDTVKDVIATLRSTWPCQCDACKGAAA